MRFNRYHPIIKCLFGMGICYLPILLINSMILKPIFLYLNFTEEEERIIRFLVNIVLLLVLYQLFIKKSEDTYSIRWKVSSLIMDFGKGGSLAIGIIATIIFVLSIIGNYEIVQIRFDLLDTLYLLIVLLFMSLLEEVLFRGIVFRIVENWIGLPISIFVSSLLFSMPHLFNEDSDWLSFLAATIGGMILGLLFSISKQIWMPFGFHLFWNFSQVNFGSNLSGSGEFSSKAIIQSKLSGSNWLTGGSAGIENSLITIGLTLLLAILLFIYVMKQKENLLLVSSKIE